jgi:hypothetical protein
MKTKALHSDGKIFPLLQDAGLHVKKVLVGNNCHLVENTISVEEEKQLAHVYQSSRLQSNKISMSRYPCSFRLLTTVVLRATSRLQLLKPSSSALD